MDIRQLSEEVETVSRQYAQTHHIERDETWFLLKLQEEVGELTQAYLMLAGQARQKGKTREELQGEFHQEIADTLCHVLLLARYHGVDLERIIREKWLSWNQK